MILPKSFDALPDSMKREEVREYYDSLEKKRFQLLLKRAFDIVVSLLLILILSPVMIALAVVIKSTSEGPVFFRQTRVTTFGKEFYILKFRSMIQNADKIGPLVTVGNDERITKVGRFLRKTHLDEVPQLFNVLKGEMSFVGTRPEVPKYVAAYSDSMMASLLLPAGITSEASIRFTDEAELLSGAFDADSTYINVILPQKMIFNLNYLREFSVINDLYILVQTFLLFLGVRNG